MAKISMGETQFNVTDNSRQQIDKVKPAISDQSVNLGQTVQSPRSTGTKEAPDTRVNKSFVPPLPKLASTTTSQGSRDQQVATLTPTIEVPAREIERSEVQIPVVEVPRFDMPQIFIKNITLNNFGDDIISKVNFNFKLSYDESTATILQSYSEGFVINLIQIRNDKLYSFLNLSKELLWYIVSPDRLVSLPTIMLNISKNIGLTKNGTVEEIKAVFTDNRNVKIVTISPQDSLAVARREMDSGGNSAINLNYSREFRMPNRTKHLSYFAYADLNKEIMQDININDIFEIANIRASSEIVINNNNLINHTYGYYLLSELSKEKTLWTDFKHFDGQESQWLTGRPTDKKQNKKPLTREVFFNTKIIDNSIFEKLDIKIGTVPKNIAKITSLTSPVKMVSVGEQSIDFQVNTELLLEKHSALYSFVTSINLNNSNIIRNIRVFKKRVKTVKKVKYLEDFRKNEPVVYLKDPPIVIDNKRPINVITVTDNQVEAGKYCYGLEINFFDILKADLETNLIELKKYQNILSRYYEDSTIKDINYDYEQGSFTEKFFKENENNRDIVKAAEVYLESYARVIPDTTVATEIKKQILSQISPKTGNPLSISRFIRSMGSLIKHYGKILDNASFVGSYDEKKYFNSFEQVVEFQPAAASALDGSAGSLYGSFFDKNNLTIEKNNNEIYSSIQEKDVWDNMDKENKQYATEWFSLTNYVLNKYENVSNDDKYRKAIAALKEISNTRVIRRITDYTGSKRSNTVDRFTLTLKSDKRVIQENLRNIHLSILSVPREYVTTNVMSDLKIEQVMNSVAESNR